MNDLIIVGGSPFVNTVDLRKLDYTKYDVLAINKQPYGIPVNYLLGVDEINPTTAPKTERILRVNGWKFNRNNHWDLKNKELCYVCYSSSCACLFAYLKGYKNVYLIGVDLKEDNKPFVHWHGVVNERIAEANSIKPEKAFIYNIAKEINIYQCNKEVLSEWELPYFNVKDLLTKDNTKDLATC